MVLAVGQVEPIVEEAVFLILQGNVFATPTSQLFASHAALEVRRPIDHGPDKMVAIVAKLREVVVHRDLWVAFAVAQSAEGGIGCEAIEPSGEGSVAAKGDGLLVEG
jgi:hypothetical protein